LPKTISIDNTTTAKMPKEVKQKSGLIVGVNAGHSMFAHTPFLESRSIDPRKNTAHNLGGCGRMLTH
jgi:hypothetical protein